MAQKCQRQTIEITTKDGVVRFTGRPGGARSCPVVERPEPTPAQECSMDVFAKAIEYCKVTGKSTLHQRLCIGPTIRRIATVVRCGEKP